MIMQIMAVFFFLLFIGIGVGGLFLAIGTVVVTLVGEHACPPHPGRAALAFVVSLLLSSAFFILAGKVAEWGHMR